MLGSPLHIHINSFFSIAVLKKLFYYIIIHEALKEKSYKKKINVNPIDLESAICYVYII